jgi:hypothetical protein
MAVVRTPVIVFRLNSVNISTSILPYILKISIEDVFDTKFTVSKLTIQVDSKYAGKWVYKDQITIAVSWSTNPADVLTTNIFYLDYINDSKDSDQTYTINCLEADLSLGFQYGGAITITNKTVKQFIADFVTTFGLTVTETAGLNVFIGNIPIPDNYAVGTALPNNATVSKTFKSYSEAIIWVCATFGYFGNISGKYLQILKLTKQTLFESDFTVPDFSSILSMSVDRKYTQLYKIYTAFFSKNTGRDLDIIDVANTYGITSKELSLYDEQAYYNSESGTERATGRMYLDYLDSFNISIRSIGFPTFKAGKKFYLGQSYGQNSGIYRTLKVFHSITPSEWVADIEGFPLDSLVGTSASFKSERLGITSNKSTLTYSQLISSVMPVTISTTNLDAYARTLNPAYTINLAANFIIEGNAEGIRYDIAFCLALVLTANFTYQIYLTNFNPGHLAASDGTTFATFTSWQLGIRATIQHLFAFAVPSSGTGSRALVNAVVDPRFSNVPRASAPKILDLSNRWLVSPTLGQAVIEKLNGLYRYLGYNNPINLP